MKPATAASLLLLALTPSAAPASRSYVDGMVIAQFKGEYMPSAAQVSLTGPAPYLGHQGVDEVLRSHGCCRIGKFLATFDRETSAAGKRLERCFIIYYTDGTDPSIVCDELAAFTCFESVRPNQRLHKIYGGTKQVIPSEFAIWDQWNLHSPANDDRDIDAPEAWASSGETPTSLSGLSTPAR